jgi:hypothetical protein
MNNECIFDRVLRVAVSLIAVAAVAAGPAAADVVRLKNGQSLEGDVIESGGQVKIRSAGGTIGFPADIVLRIERGEGVEKQAVKRLQSLSPNDVEGRVDLALELQEAGATTLAQRIFESVLNLDPDHPTARRALGYVRCEDDWTSDEECHHRRGEVLYQGRWVGTEEHRALEALEHERRRSDLERLRSEIQVESARLEADRAAMSYNDYGSPYYDPYYFGGVPYYPGYYPFYGSGVGRPGGRFDGRFDGRHPAHHGGFDRGGRSNRFGPGHDGRRVQGGLHHAGGQPARPLTPTHSTNSLAPRR